MSSAMALWTGLLRTPRTIGRVLVRGYRYTLSPLVGFHCRHLPTCSDYADEAIGRFGLWAGGWMTLARNPCVGVCAMSPSKASLWAVNDNFLARRGRWLGYTPERKERIQSLLRRWGGITVLTSRTLVWSLSSIISLLAGVSRYRLWRFLVFALLGRLLWTSAYLGLG